MTTFAPRPQESDIRGHKMEEAANAESSHVNGATINHNEDASIANGALTNGDDHNSHDAGDSNAPASDAAPLKSDTEAPVKSQTPVDSVEDHVMGEPSSLTVEAESQAAPTLQPSEPDSGVDVSYNPSSEQSDTKGENTVDVTMSQEVSNMGGPSDATADSNDVLPSQITSNGQSIESTQPLSQPVDEDHVMTDDTVVRVKTPREREEDDEQKDQEPAAKRTKTEETEPNTSDLPPTQSAANPPAASSTPSAPPHQTELAGATPPSKSVPDPASTYDTTTPSGDYGEMTEVQTKLLLESLRNLKKANHAKAFLLPVDPVAMQLPKYPEVIKEPMDLGTIEGKLKSKSYGSVNDYVRDFDLMVKNAITFNTHSHPVSQNGMALQQTMRKQLGRVPKVGQAPPPPAAKPKPAFTAPQTRDHQRRPSRPSLSTSNSQTFGLNENGVPQIRRDSTVGTGDRPKREIKKAAPKDLPYSRPKKKKFETELQFCANTLAELKKPRYSAFSYPFQQPVDPVALNIPDYRKVIKKPMAISDVDDKMKRGEYENAKEFEQDVRLVFTNCFKFNPTGNPVYEMGKQYENLFNDLWKEKNEFVKKNQPAVSAAVASGESDEESEEENEPESESDDDKDAKLQALHKQIAALQEQTLAMMSSSSSKPAKSKDSKKGSKGAKAEKPAKGSKKGGKGAAKVEKKPKKEKKQRPVTAKEKNEIAERIMELPTDKISRAAEIIKAAFRRIGRNDLANKSDEELEFEIELIPNDALHDLLNLVRTNLPSRAPAPPVDDGSDYESAPKLTKPRKRKSGVKDGQIEQLQARLSQFKNPESSQAQAAAMQDESSGDEPDSASESEEE